MKFVRIVL